MTTITCLLSEMWGQSRPPHDVSTHCIYILRCYKSYTPYAAILPLPLLLLILLHLFRWCADICRYIYSTLHSTYLDSCVVCVCVSYQTNISFQCALKYNAPIFHFCHTAASRHIDPAVSSSHGRYAAASSRVIHSYLDGMCYHRCSGW